jgi:hypothetical protein
MAELDDLPLVGMEFWSEKAWWMWYAGLAMQAMVYPRLKPDDTGVLEPEKVAEWAFTLACALIERSKR